MCTWMSEENPQELVLATVWILGIGVMSSRLKVSSLMSLEPSFLN